MNTVDGHAGLHPSQSPRQRAGQVAAVFGTLWPAARLDLVPTDRGIDVGIELNALRHVVCLADLLDGERFELNLVRQLFRQRVPQRLEAALEPLRLAVAPEA